MGRGIVDKIPVSVLIVTKNESQNIARCLAAVQDFAQVIVVDSHSEDNTCDIARAMGAEVVLYRWDGQYPKKRQWCLETLKIGYNWVFWVDADEALTPEIVDELRSLFMEVREEAGFFVRGCYVWGGKVLRYGMQNNKIALMNREKLCFPVVDDLYVDGMGEIEGHYQPVFTEAGRGCALGQVAAPLLHYAGEDRAAWVRRHARYAVWEAVMTEPAAVTFPPFFDVFAFLSF